jgi:hypothetical protein
LDISVLLWLGPGLSDGLGGVSKLFEDASVERLDAAAFGLGELVGDGQLLEVDERLSDGLEAGFESDGWGRQRWRWLGLQAALWVAQQLAAIVFVSDAVGADQRDGFVAAEPMTLEGGDQRGLVRVGHRAQRVGESGADLRFPQLLLCRCCEVPADVDTACHPARALAQQPGDLGLALAVVVDERADDPRLVEGGHGARRGVGAEQQPLVLRGRGRPLDYDRRELTALLAPAAQALEAIDDLVAAVADRRDTQGQLGCSVGLLSRRACAQRPV